MLCATAMQQPYWGLDRVVSSSTQGTVPTPGLTADKNMSPSSWQPAVQPFLEKARPPRDYSVGLIWFLPNSKVCKLWLHCGHEYTSARAEEERKGNGHGVPQGEMCQKWAKQMTEKGRDCSLRIPEEVNATEENNVILANNNIDIRRNGNILATGRFSLETTEDFHPLEAWGCGAAFQEERASCGGWSSVERFYVKGLERGLSASGAPLQHHVSVIFQSGPIIFDQYSGFNCRLPNNREKLSKGLFEY